MTPDTTILKALKQTLQPIYCYTHKSSHLYVLVTRNADITINLTTQDLTIQIRGDKRKHTHQLSDPN